MPGSTGEDDPPGTMGVLAVTGVVRLWHLVALAVNLRLARDIIADDPGGVCPAN